MAAAAFFLVIVIELVSKGRHGHKSRSKNEGAGWISELA